SIMPGICGIAARAGGGGDAHQQATTMQQVLVQEPWHVALQQCETPPKIGLAAVSLDGAGAKRRIAYDAATRSAIVLDGELLETSQLVAALRQIGTNIAENEHARLLLVGYLAEGDAFLRGLHGSFTAAIWHGGERQLALITDRFGTRPLYYSQLGQTFRF